MPSLVQWKNSKGQINRNWNSFKFRMYWPCYGKLVGNKFYFIADKSEMRRIKITGSKSSSQSIKYIIILFFYDLAIYIHFTLLGISAFRKPFAAFHIKAY